MPGFLSGGDKPRGRGASESAPASMSHGILMSEEARREMLEWMLRALGSKRVAQKLNGDHGVVLEHAWIFQFIDIIYVGTIFKLSHLIGNCGRGIDVYMLTFSYFAVMFSSRQAFDVYTCISGANGILHLIAFCFYGIGVFIMTVNISSHSKNETLAAQCGGDHVYFSSYNSGVQVTYGSCERSIDYDFAFAAAFVFTRFVLVVMYGLYFFVFHESNIIGHAPAMDNMGAKLRFSDLTRESDLEVAVRESEMKHSSMKIPMVSVDSSQHSSHHLSHETSVDNPLTRLTMHRPSFVIKVANNFRESVVKKHFTRIFALKVAPVVLSSIVMCAMLFGASPVVVLPIAAFIEFAGDFLPSYFVTDPSDWRDLNPHRHFAQERLGLFFMLVMGEAVLGFASVNYTSENMSKIYRVLLFSFATIFTVGMQHFEPLQSYTKPEGPHPLDVQKLSPIYVWLVCLTSFFMLIAANGMVEIYKEIGAPLCVHLNHRDLNYEKQKVANGLGSVVLLIIIMKLLDKVYYRERLLPTFAFNWLNQFYSDAEATLKPQSSNDAALGDDLSGHSESDLRASFSSERPSITVVRKDQVAIGIRKIKPLTNLKILCAAFMFVLWHFSIAAEDYMSFNAALVVFPSVVEVILEVRNFFLRQRMMRHDSASVQLGPMGVASKGEEEPSRA